MAFNDLGFEKQAAGTDLNTWGDPKLNNVIDRIRYAISGFVSIAVTGDYTLTSANSSTDQADFQGRNGILKFTGTLAADATITVPTVPMRWMVWNATNKVLTFSTGSGLTATVQAGENVLLSCDATNVKRVQGTDFGGAQITDVADPTTAQGVATKNYADNLAFTANAGNLPAQAGSAGKFVTTNGTVATWQQLTSADLSDTAARDTAATARAVALAVAL